MKTGHRSESANLLLIEDGATDAMLVREALADGAIGVNVRVVENAASAMAFLLRQPPYERAARPNVVMLDLNMPALGGHELLADIKSDARLSAIPVIIFTTSDAETDIADAYRNRANCFVTKPRDFDEFAAAVRGIVALWGACPLRVAPLCALAL